jgi:hypothetical protein
VPHGFFLARGGVRRSEVGLVTSEHGVQDRVLGVWGAHAYAWSGEERPRVFGFPVDTSGRQRVLGFPADPLGSGHHRWFRRRERPEAEPAGRRTRIVVAVVAILSSGEEEPGD